MKPRGRTTCLPTRRITDLDWPSCFPLHLVIATFFLIRIWWRGKSLLIKLHSVQVSLKRGSPRNGEKKEMQSTLHRKTMSCTTKNPPRGFNKTRYSVTKLGKPPPIAAELQSCIPNFLFYFLSLPSRLFPVSIRGLAFPSVRRSTAPGTPSWSMFYSCLSSKIFYIKTETVFPQLFSPTEVN